MTVLTILNVSECCSGHASKVLVYLFFVFQVLEYIALIDIDF